MRIERRRRRHRAALEFVEARRGALEQEDLNAVERLVERDQEASARRETPQIAARRVHIEHREVGRDGLVEASEVVGRDLLVPVRAAAEWRGETQRTVVGAEFATDEVVHEVERPTFGQLQLTKQVFVIVHRLSKRRRGVHSGDGQIWQGAFVRLRPAEVFD